MRRLLYFPIFFLIVLIQVVLVTEITIYGVSPDIILIFLVVFSLFCKTPLPEIMGFFVGLLFGLSGLSGLKSLGFYPFIYTAICFVNSFWIKHIFSSNPKLIETILVVATSFVFKGVLIFILRMAFFSFPSISGYSFLLFLGDTCYSLLLVIPVYFLLKPLLFSWELINEI